jgi:TIR domain-containing protein
MMPIVFLSYAHADVECMASIKLMLDELKYGERIQLFHDSDIQASEDWNDEIESHLREATHVLVAISDSYIASHYVRTKELPAIKNKVETGGATIFPLLIKGRNWEIFADADRASFLNRKQWWPVLDGRRIPLCDLPAIDQVRQIKILRQRFLPEDTNGDPPRDGEWWQGDEPSVSAHLMKLELRDIDCISAIGEQLPYYLSAVLNCNDVVALVAKANELLYEKSKSDFRKRRVPEPPMNLLGQEPQYWSQILLDLSERSPLSIVVLLALARHKAPAVDTSIRKILDMTNGGVRV